LCHGALAIMRAMRQSGAVFDRPDEETAMTDPEERGHPYAEPKRVAREGRGS
jgi:hypothetical protein